MCRLPLPWLTSATAPAVATTNQATAFWPNGSIVGPLLFRFRFLLGGQRATEGPLSARSGSDDLAVAVAPEHVLPRALWTAAAGRVACEIGGVAARHAQVQRDRRRPVRRTGDAAAVFREVVMQRTAPNRRFSMPRASILPSGVGIRAISIAPRAVRRIRWPSRHPSRSKCGINPVIWNFSDIAQPLLEHGNRKDIRRPIAQSQGQYARTSCSPVQAHHRLHCVAA